MDSCCWDASVFLSWLGGPTVRRTPDELANLRAAAKDVVDRTVVLVTTSMIFVEVLRHKHSPETYQCFREMLARSNVEVFDVTPPIAELAGDLRDRSGREPDLQIMDAADAIYLATALSFNCTSMHSYDPHILQFGKHLGGQVAVTKPTGRQLDLGIS